MNRPPAIVHDGHDLRPPGDSGNGMPRTASLLLVHLLAVAVHGQSITRKQLFTSLGGGAGLLTIREAADSVSAAAEAGGAITFRVSYAFTRRFSLGFQYDRIGSDRIGKAVDQMRFSTFVICGAYRPWIGERAFVEVHGAIGTASLTLDLNALALPVVGRSGCTSIGARYVHLLSGTVCGFVGIEATGGARIYVQRYDGEPFTDADGEPGGLDWSSQRLVLGLAVRF